MKTIIQTLAFLFLTANLHCQLTTATTGTIVFGQSSDYDNCGTWKPLPANYTDWKTIDTILKTKPINATRNFVYGDIKILTSNTMYAVNEPCGSGRPVVSEQLRVCLITGIRQQRIKIQSYQYIPKQKSPYDAAIDSLYKIK